MNRDLLGTKLAEQCSSCPNKSCLYGLYSLNALELMGNSKFKEEILWQSWM